ncbi:MAG: Gfo/Idh/MocA family oxidoreductase, partial [Planctomycetota bacterium]
MTNKKTNRRGFLRQGMAAGAMAGFSALRTPASSYARVIGANDRINLGLIGCGGRGRYIIKNMAKPADANINLGAINDIWKMRRDSYPAEVEELFGAKPKVYKDYRELLENPDIDAVVIATPAHQHCGQTIDAVRAGKH